MTRLLYNAALIIAVSTVSSETDGGPLIELPSGNSGIASGHPNDIGIESHPDVVFADDFESYASKGELHSKWDVVISEANLSIASGPAETYKGERALRMSIPKRTSPLSTSLARNLSNTYDTLFFRYYLKFAPTWYIPSASVHNGASMSSKYYVNGGATPGVPANGTNKFLVNLENENSRTDPPGSMNVYIYWPEQGSEWGDHFFPSGKVLPFSSTRSGSSTFGDDFEARPDFNPQLGTWYCYEYMVKANTPGERDGRIAIWVDGELIADFPNLRLRDTDELKIDRFSLGLYIANNSDRENFKYHDNLVVATSYIGPVANRDEASQRPELPSNLVIVDQ